MEALAQGRLVGIGQKDAAQIVAALDFHYRKHQRLAAKLGVQARRGAGVFLRVGKAVFHCQDIHLAAQTPDIGLDGTAVNRDAACHR